MEPNKCQSCGTEDPGMFEYPDAPRCVPCQEVQDEATQEAYDAEYADGD